MSKKYCRATGCICKCNLSFLPRLTVCVHRVLCLCMLYMRRPVRVMSDTECRKTEEKKRTSSDAEFIVGSSSSPAASISESDCGQPLWQGLACLRSGTQMPTGKLSFYIAEGCLGMVRPSPPPQGQIRRTSMTGKTRVLPKDLDRLCSDQRRVDMLKPFQGCRAFVLCCVFLSSSLSFSIPS